MSNNVIKMSLTAYINFLSRTKTKLRSMHIDKYSSTVL